MNTRKAFIVSLLFLVTITIVNAQTQKLINVQGKLVKNGQPVNGQKPITFKIYTTATGGTPIWSETQSNVTITNGIFKVKTIVKSYFIISY